MAEKRAEEAGQNTIGLLEQFLGEFEKVPALVVEGMVRQTDNEDERTVIRSFGGVLQNQIQELCTYVRARRPALTPQQEQEVAQVLRLTSAVPLATSTVAVARSLPSSAARIGLLWIVQEIKKIIRVLWHILFGHMPHWLDELLNLINEILKDILSVGDTRLADTLSQMEQNYLAELTQLARLKHANEMQPEAGAEDDRSQ
jgi:hypothetical protein